MYRKTAIVLALMIVLCIAAPALAAGYPDTWDQTCQAYPDLSIEDWEVAPIETEDSWGTFAAHIMEDTDINVIAVPFREDGLSVPQSDFETIRVADVAHMAFLDNEEQEITALYNLVPLNEKDAALYDYFKILAMFPDAYKGKLELTPEEQGMTFDQYSEAFREQQDGKMIVRMPYTTAGEPIYEDQWVNTYVSDVGFIAELHIVLTFDGASFDSDWSADALYDVTGTSRPAPIPDDGPITLTQLVQMAEGLWDGTITLTELVKAAERLFL